MVVVVVVIVDICRTHIHESDNIANKKYCPSLLLRVPQGTHTWLGGRPARWGVGGGSAGRPAARGLRRKKQSECDVVVGAGGASSSGGSSSAETGER